MDAALPPLLVPPEHRKVLAALAGHVGRDQALGQAELAQRTGLSARKVRTLIHELVVELRQRICSTYGAAGQAGYYLPADEREALEAARAIKDHALAMLRRASVLERTTVEGAVQDLYRMAREDAA